MLLNLFHQPFAFVDSISVIHWMVLELPHTRAYVRSHIMRCSTDDARDFVYTSRSKCRRGADYARGFLAVLPFPRETSSVLAQHETPSPWGIAGDV